MRVLPMPASPDTSTSWPRPPRARSSAPPQLGLLALAADEGDPVGVLGPLGQGRWGRGQVGVGDGEDVLGPGQALEQVRADVDELGPVGQLVGDQLGGGPRQQDLDRPGPAPAGGPPG